MVLLRSCPLIVAQPVPGDPTGLPTYTVTGWPATRMVPLNEVVLPFEATEKVKFPLFVPV